MNRYWLYILSAGVLEVAWVSGLKYSNTFIEWGATILAIITSFAVLILASKPFTSWNGIRCVYGTWDSWYRFSGNYIV